MTAHSRLAAALSFALTLAACGTNPVTGKKELQFISESQEIVMGEQNYAPTRQAEGGDLKVLPELTAYVNSVGQKLAAAQRDVAVDKERKLPYEFVVLNSSVPNAWALPGGKIAVNRGLLSTLENEAELAAVLGHEITHAAARHGAKAQERGTFLQAGMVATQIGLATSGRNPQLGNVLLQGAGLGAQLMVMKYGRDAELEADHYGMIYMQRAGYDPRAAISLQKKFVALSQQQGGNKGWLDGLFASHPPSEERVKRNEETAATLGVGAASLAAGELGADRYKAQLAGLRAAKPAYDKADEATKAAVKKDYPRAKALAAEAAQLLPREARFQQLQGDIAMAEKQPKTALGFYSKAMDLDASYFGPFLGGGIAAYKTGDRARAQDWLGRSNKLLPTAPGVYYLGLIAKDSGDRATAVQYFKQAASSDSEIGQSAAMEMLQLDLPQNPGNYIASGIQQDAKGQVMVILENRAPAPLAGIKLSLQRLNATGNAIESTKTLQLTRALQPGERIAVDAGLGAVAPEMAQRLRVHIDAAQAQAPAAAPQ